MNRDRHSLALGLVIACTCGTGCHLLPEIPDPLNLPTAKARNLEQLHSAEDGYRYNAILLGDFGHLLEMLTGRDRQSYMLPSAVSNPAGETLENLLELVEAPPARLGAADIQIEWCSRLIKHDPSALVRERATIALGELGSWSGMTVLTTPPTPENSAGPDEIAAALEGLLQSLRVAREEPGEDPGITEACAAAAALSLDLDGGWRLLSTVSHLRSLSANQAGDIALENLLLDLRTRLIEGGIFAALSDPSDRVRTAGLRSMAKLGGVDALAVYLIRPIPGLSNTTILSLVDIVAESGLPMRGLSEQERAACLNSLLGWAVDHPSSRVRVRSMIALQRAAPDGPRSLREEDWHHWEERLGAAREEPL